MKLLSLFGLLLLSVVAFAQTPVQSLQTMDYTIAYRVKQASAPVTPTQTSLGIPVNLQGYWDFTAHEGIGALSTNIGYTPFGNGWFFALNPFVGATFSGESDLVGGTSIGIGTTIGNLFHAPTWNWLNVAVNAGECIDTNSKIHAIAGGSLSGVLHF
jgi:hypothetical protein